MRWLQCYDFLWNEDGPTAVEYAVMLALILVVAIGAITAFGTDQGGLWGVVGGRLEVMNQ